jgi:BASS family bile acid:Na+ symporter
MHLDILIKLLNIVALSAIMLAMGLGVRTEEVLDSARRPRLILLGLLANYVLVPAVTLVLLILFRANPMVAVGFFTLAVCPGAPVAPPMVGVARGNVPLAVSLMVILAALSALLSPALLSAVLARLAPDRELHIDYVAIIQTLLVAQMLPLALGLGLRHWAPGLAKRLVRATGLLSNVLLLGLVVLILASQYETLAAIRLRGWTGMGVLLLSSLGLGWLCGGPDMLSRRAMAVVTGPRNAAVGLVIANSNFANTPAVTAVIAYGLISMVGTLGVALLIGRLPVDKEAAAKPL